MRMAFSWYDLEANPGAQEIAPRLHEIDAFAELEPLAATLQVLGSDQILTVYEVEDIDEEVDLDAITG